MPRSVKISPDAPGVTVTTVDGRSLTLCRGLTFVDRPSATAFFQDFAKAQGKRLVINKKKSGGAQYEYVCASRSPRCTFRIKLLKSRSAHSAHFFVSSFDAHHATECAVAPKLTVRQAAAVLVGNTLDARVSSAAVATVVSVKALQERLHVSSGELISSRKAYRVRDLVLRVAAGAFVQGFQKVESLLRGFRAKNHGAHVAFELEDASRRFQRAFLAHPFVATYERSRALHPVVGVDTAPLVSMNYRGQVFVLVSKDGNDHVLPLCVAVAPQDDVDNWTWFLTQCQEAQVNLSRRVIVADRTRALVSATQGLGLLVVRQCTQHLLATLKTMLKHMATEQVEDFFWRAQSAESEAEFTSCLSMIGLTCPAAETYLRGLDPRTWSLFCVAQQMKLYGWKSTLFSMEDQHALLRLAPYDVMQYYMERFRTLALKQKVDVTQWTQDGKVFTQHAETLLAEQREAANFQLVQPSTDGILVVTEPRSFPLRRYCVDLSQRRCSCAFLQQMGVPCRHVIAGLAFFQRSEEEEGFMDTLYRVSTLAAMFDTNDPGTIELVGDDEVHANQAIKVPLGSRKRGRPKGKHVPAENEVVGTPGVASALGNDSVDSIPETGI